MKRILFVMFLVLSARAHAVVQSSTLKSDQMWAWFFIKHDNDEPSVKIYCDTFYTAESMQGDGDPEGIVLSGGDEIVFKVNDYEVKCNPEDTESDWTLPYIAGETYSMTFIRGNGEIISQNVVMAGPVTVYPKKGSVFYRDEEVIFDASIEVKRGNGNTVGGYECIKWTEMRIKDGNMIFGSNIAGACDESQSRISFSAPAASATKKIPEFDSASPGLTMGSYAYSYWDYIDRP